MPNYSYKCTACETIFDNMATIRHRNDPQPCPDCGKLAGRFEEAEYGCHRHNGECDHLRYSESLGCVASQIDEMRKLHPGAEFVRKGDGYVMAIHNRSEKLRRCRERGMVEFDPHRDC